MDVRSALPAAWIGVRSLGRKLELVSKELEMPCGASAARESGLFWQSSRAALCPFSAGHALLRHHRLLGASDDGLSVMIGCAKDCVVWREWFLHGRKHMSLYKHERLESLTCRAERIANLNARRGGRRDRRRQREGATSRSSAVLQQASVSLLRKGVLRASSSPSPPTMWPAACPSSGSIFPSSPSLADSTNINGNPTIGLIPAVLHPRLRHQPQLPLTTPQ